MVSRPNGLYVGTFYCNFVTPYHVQVVKYIRSLSTDFRKSTTLKFTENCKHTTVVFVLKYSTTCHMHPADDRIKSNFFRYLCVAYTIDERSIRVPTGGYAEYAACKMFATYGTVNIYIYVYAFYSGRSLLSVLFFVKPNAIMGAAVNSVRCIVW